MTHGIIAGKGGQTAKRLQTCGEEKVTAVSDPALPVSPRKMTVSGAGGLESGVWGLGFGADEVALLVVRAVHK
jgi:hypothetical protein